MHYYQRKIREREPGSDDKTETIENGNDTIEFEKNAPGKEDLLVFLRF